MKKGWIMISLLLVAALLFGGCQFLPGQPQEEHVHTLIHNEEKAPTCVNNGIIEHWMCLECGKRFGDAEATQEVTFADLEVEENGHIAGEDDNDCTTAIDCTVCGKVATAGKEHTPAEDDGDCTTAVACTACEKNAVEAKSHTDADGDYLCDNEGCTYEFPGAPAKIYTVEELQEAFAKGGNYKLMNDLDLGENFVSIEGQVDLALDLGGYTLTLGRYPVDIYYDSTVALSNGTVKQTEDMEPAVYCRGTITISDCTLIGCNYYALYVVDGTATVENSVLTGGMTAQTSYEDTATLTATDNVTVTAYDDQSASGVGISRGGVIVLSFDPTSLLSGYNEGGVTDNGDGTWTLKRVETVGDGTITVSHIEIFGDAVQQDGKTFTVTIPAGELYVYINIRVIGQNVHKIVEDYLFDRKYSIGNPETKTCIITAAFTVVDAYTITYDGGAVYGTDAETNPNPIYISNDNGETWVDTGYVVIVQNAQ